MRPAKFRVFLPILLLSLGLAPSAFAERASLSDRVAALEAQATNNQGNTDLLNQVNQLRSELTDLRGTVEQLQNENQQLKQRAKDQYLDLDGRLSRLEGGGAAPAGGAATPPVAVPTADAGGAAANSPAAAAPAAGVAGSAAPSGDERAAYGVAFDALKKGDYAGAANLFNSFLQQYPSGAYAPNALYWLGESYYVTQNYQMAADQFQALLSRYPTHDKASGALLKLGLSQYGLGKVSDAEATLKSVISQYPNSDVARTAQDRLHSIQVGQVH